MYAYILYHANVQKVQKRTCWHLAGLPVCAESACCVMDYWIHSVYVPVGDGYSLPSCESLEASLREAVLSNGYTLLC